MATHRKQRANFFKRLTRKQAIGVIAVITAFALLIIGGIASSHMHMYAAATSSEETVTSYSASEEDLAQITAADAKAALAEGRNGVTQGTSYTKVIIDGHARFVFGTHFTDVQSVLEQGNITLEPDDTITPSLTTKVTEATIITITSAGTTVQTVDMPINYNVIKKSDPSLPVGTTKVQTQGQKGIMQTTNLVRKVGNKEVSTNTLASWVKKVPVNEVILVGTKEPQATSTANTSSNSSSNNSSSSSSSSNSSQSSSSSSSNADTNIGTTEAVGTPQTIAQQMVAARGWSASQFTCLVELWQKESGWSVTAENPSGAYGIPQALPGSKMGPGWQSSATVQITWGLGYIAGRYGTPCNAWAHEVSDGWY
ncbi:MAG: G5 domain-containing protein [Aeriscardovia sp.]|nr:G5 domain-containing protein [Aeriscardovia sp.]